MRREASGICGRELTGTAPDWVHLFPSGPMTGRDGRRFNLTDPRAVIAAFDQARVDLPVDYGHQNDRKPQGRAGSGGGLDQGAEGRGVGAAGRCLMAKDSSHTVAETIDERRRRLRQAVSEVDAAIRQLEEVLEASVEHAVQPASNSAFSAAEHRRLHRPGRPRRIDTDPELRAFVLDRIDRMTFEELADAIARHFPPDRRIGKSAIHDWFHIGGKHVHT